MKTEHDKAVALAEKYAEYNWDEHYLETVTAMLADHKQQVRDEYREELVQRSGVMPSVLRVSIGGNDVCFASQVHEAIASLEARLGKLQDYKQKYLLLASQYTRDMEQSEARVRELEQAFRHVISIRNSASGAGQYVTLDAIEKVASEAINKESGK